MSSLDWGIHADAIAKMEWEDEWTGNTKRDKARNDLGWFRNAAQSQV